MSDYKPISEALEHKIGEFLCWPKYDEEEAQQRLNQLKELRVESVAIGGPHRVLGTPILGKGHAGVVLRAIYDGREVALKARRTDTSRVSMKREASFLIHANKWNVGPKLLGFSEDFIVMELLIGPYFGEWVKQHINDCTAIKNGVAAVLYISWRLDQSGLDHGELTRIRRHYIVTTDGPRVIDFESASMNRQPSNLTSTIQSLFMKHRFATLLGKAYPMPERELLLEALKHYKTNPIEENYMHILRVCNIDIGDKLSIP